MCQGYTESDKRHFGILKDFGVRQVWIQAFFPPFIRYLTSGKFLTLSEPQFPILSNGDTQLEGLLRGLNETKLPAAGPTFWRCLDDSPSSSPGLRTS